MSGEIISSGQNPKIKELLLLQQKSRRRRETGLFVVEGRRELEHCLASGYEADCVFYCSEILGCDPREVFTSVDSNIVLRGVSSCTSQLVVAGSSTLSGAADNIAEPRYFEVTREVYDKIAYRGGTEGIIAQMRCRPHGLDRLHLGPDPLVVVLESVEKPGNLGAVLRSADAAGADAVIVCDPLTDLYNPNLIRSSIGAVFTVPCASCTSAECIAWLKEHEIQVLTAQLQDSEWYYDTDMRRGTAIVIGTEATGLTQAWRDAADAHIKIPMLGRLDSLNASVSAAILLYEAVRQREGASHGI